MILNHFQAMLLFALIVSVAFAFLARRNMGERLKYGLWAFLAFLLVGVAMGWLMYPMSR